MNELKTEDLYMMYDLLNELVMLSTNCGTNSGLTNRFRDCNL